VFVNAGLGETSASAVARYTPSAAAVSPPKILLDDSLVKTAYGEKYLDMFWDMYLPDGWSLDNKTLSDFSVGTWTTLARNIYQNEPAVKVALLAHCFATVGTRDNKKWMVDQSLKMYVTALGNVRAGLYHRTKWRSDSLVVASRGLASYEVRHFVESTSCLHHPIQLTLISDSLRSGDWIIQRRPTHPSEKLA
jgi:hypothetical protein